MSVNFHKLSERLIAEQQPINIHRALNLNPPRDAVCGGDITALDIPARLSLAPPGTDAVRVGMCYPIEMTALPAHLDSVNLGLGLIGVE